MAGREESLRNILAAVPGSVGLTDEQRKEIVAHLDDSVDAKIGAGTPEVEAVAQAFVELGDVRKIARRFPPPPLLSTPEGIRIIAASRYRAGTALGLLMFFMIAQRTITPQFVEVFNAVKVQPPLLSEFFIGMSAGLIDGFLIKLLIAGAGLGTVVYALPLTRAPRTVSYGLLVVACSLCLGLLVGLSLPLMRLLEGIGRR
jgi:hypothetical protein